MRDRIIVITGGRDFKDRELLCDLLEWLEPAHLILGDCPTGADRFAYEWVTNIRDVGFEVCRADWAKWGKAAGPIRNQAMIETAKGWADAKILAFPGGNGTEDCCRRATAAGITILRVEPGKAQS